MTEPVPTTPLAETSADQATVPLQLDPTAAPLLPQVPGFEVLRVLGRGGMGVVYLARQVGLNRLVALKMIRTGGHADATQRQRFQIEAEAVARLAHPGIVQVHQIGAHENEPFLVLEYVAGGALNTHLAGQPQPATTCATWTRSLSEAVQAAHAAGIVHRDLKPGNVLLTEPGVACGVLKVTDFGLAKEFAEASGGDSPTATGAVLGTPSYMAPEQAEGRTHEVGPPADIWALGAILYEMLTGRPPFKADSALNTLRLVAAAEPVPPRQLNPTTPRDLEVICLACLRKEPARRYHTAQALADDLGRFLRGEPIHARPVGWAERAWRWVRRNPVVAVLSAGVVLALVLGLGFALHYNSVARGEAAAARLAAEGERAARVKETESRYFAELNLAAFAYQNGELSRTNKLLANWEPRPDTPDRRGPEWGLLQRQANGSVRVHEYAGLSAFVLAWHPSGERVYCVREGRLLGLEVTDGRLAFDVPAPFPALALAVRPDGGQLALAAGRRLYLLDAATGAVQYQSPTANDLTRALAYRADGRELAIGGGDNRVRILDPATGEVRHHLDGPDAFVRGLGYVAGTGHVVGVDVYGALIRWDVETEEMLWKVQLGRAVPQALALHPTRPVAAVGFSAQTEGRDSGRLELYDLDRGSLLTATEALGGWVNALTFRPDGAVLAGGCTDQRVRLWDVHRVWEAHPEYATFRLRVVHECLGHHGSVSAVAWNPDGFRLASVAPDRTLRLWTPPTSALERSWPAASEFPPVFVLHPEGRSVLVLDVERHGLHVRFDGPLQARTLPDLTGRPTHGDWSSDGGHVALAIDKQVELRDGNTLRVRHRLEPHRNRVCSVRFTPDGTALLSVSDNGDVRVWDVTTGRRVRSWQGELATQRLAVSPDGAHVVACGSRVSVYRIADGALVWETRPGPNQELYSCAVFLRDGRLALGGPRGRIDLIALPHGTLEQTLLSTPQSVLGLWPTRDGRRLLSQDGEGALTVWDFATNESLRVLHGAIGKVPAGVDPEGRWLVSRTEERCALWDLRPLDANRTRRREACALVDHLAQVCVDRADLVQRVQRHPGIAADVRAEAVTLAGRYVNDADSMLWEVLELATSPGHPPATYAAQLPRADRVIRELPAEPLALVARGALHLRRGDRPSALHDLAAAERLYGAAVPPGRIWMWRLQALAQADRPDVAKALAARATAGLHPDRAADRWDRALAEELGYLLTPRP